MSELMDRIYHMLQEEAGKVFTRERADYLRRRAAMEEKIIERIGGDGGELLDELNDLDAEFEGLHNQALFRITLGLAVELARMAPPERAAHI